MHTWSILRKTWVLIIVGKLERNDSGPFIQPWSYADCLLQSKAMALYTAPLNPCQLGGCACCICMYLLCWYLQTWTMRNLICQFNHSLKMMPPKVMIASPKTQIFPAPTSILFKMISSQKVYKPLRPFPSNPWFSVSQNVFLSTCPNISREQQIRNSTFNPSEDWNMMNYARICF